MNMDKWSPVILSLVTFIPLAGALLLRCCRGAIVTSGCFPW